MIAHSLIDTLHFTHFISKISFYINFRINIFACLASISLKHFTSLPLALARTLYIQCNRPKADPLADSF